MNYAHRTTSKFCQLVRSSKRARDDARCCFETNRKMKLFSMRASAQPTPCYLKAGSNLLRTQNFELRTCPQSAGHKQSRRANNFELIFSLPFAHFLIAIAKSISLAAVGIYQYCYHFPTHRFVVVYRWYC